MEHLPLVAARSAHTLPVLPPQRLHLGSTLLKRFDLSRDLRDPEFWGLCALATILMLFA